MFYSGILAPRFLGWSYKHLKTTQKVKKYKLIIIYTISFQFFQFTFIAGLFDSYFSGRRKAVAKLIYKKINEFL